MRASARRSAWLQASAPGAASRGSRAAPAQVPERRSQQSEPRGASPLRRGGDRPAALRHDGAGRAGEAHGGVALARRPVCALPPGIASGERRLPARRPAARRARHLARTPPALRAAASPPDAGPCAGPEPGASPHGTAAWQPDAAPWPAACRPARPARERPSSAGPAVPGRPASRRSRPSQEPGNTRRGRRRLRQPCHAPGYATNTRSGPSRSSLRSRALPCFRIRSPEPLYPERTVPRTAILRRSEKMGLRP